VPAATRRVVFDARIIAHHTRGDPLNRYLMNNVSFAHGSLPLLHAKALPLVCMYVCMYVGTPKPHTYIHTYIQGARGEEGWGGS
jgi:hypothetical protein